MKQFKTLMCIAAAAMAFTGCSKDDASTNETQMVTMTVNAGEKEPVMSESRTYISGGEIFWSPQDESLTVLEAVDAATPTFATTTGCTLSDNNKKAAFTVAFPSKTGTAFTYYGIHPSAAYVTGSNTNLAEVKINLPQTQKPSLTSFDGEADLLISQKFQTTSQPTSLDLSFGRVVAIGKMSIKNLAITNGEFVKNVTFKADDKTVTGRGKVDLTAGTVLSDQWGYGVTTYNFDNVIMSYEDNIVTTPAFDAWFTCVPFEVAADGKFSVEILTSKGTYMREVTVGAGKSLAFKTNTLSDFGVDMATATFTETVEDTALFTIPFGAATTTTDYTEAYDMETTGTIAEDIVYTFAATSGQIRGNSNMFTKDDYIGASGAAFWWAPNTSLTISNITMPANLNYALIFGGKVSQAPSATIQAYISKNGTDFFPLSADGVALNVKADGDMLKTMNFHLESAITEKVSIRLTVTGGNAIIDDVRLMPLETAGANSYLMDFKAPPALTTTPDNGGSLTFAANNGTAGTAPATKEISYTWAGTDCTFEAAKATADTWYTLTDDNSGKITVAPEAYTSTTADRTGTVTLTVKKAGIAVKTSVITISQSKVGAVASYTEAFTGLTTASSSYANKGAYTSTEVLFSGTPVVWTYTNCPTNQGSGAGKSKIILGKNDPTASLVSSSIPGGISEITINWAIPYASDKLQMVVYVNDNPVKTIDITGTTNDVGTETISDLNITGDAVIKITGAAKVTGASKDNRPGLTGISWKAN